MQELTRTLDTLEALHQKVFGCAAPELMPESFLPFPPGVDPIEHARAEARRIEQLAERVAFAPRPGAWTPPADSFVADDAFVVRLDIPGVSREDVSVHVVGRECIVRGNRKPPQCAEGTRPVALERPWGSFERRFLLPAGSKVDATSARYVDGMLELSIPVDAKVLPEERTIEVG